MAVSRLASVTTYLLINDKIVCDRVCDSFFLLIVQNKSHFVDTKLQNKSYLFRI